MACQPSSRPASEGRASPMQVAAVGLPFTAVQATCSHLQLPDLLACRQVCHALHTDFSQPIQTLQVPVYSQLHKQTADQQALQPTTSLDHEHVGKGQEAGSGKGLGSSGAPMADASQEPVVDDDIVVTDATVNDNAMVSISAVHPNGALIMDGGTAGVNGNIEEASMETLNTVTDSADVDCEMHSAYDVNISGRPAQQLPGTAIPSLPADDSDLPVFRSNMPGSLSDTSAVHWFSISGHHNMPVTHTATDAAAAVDLPEISPSDMQAKTDTPLTAPLLSDPHDTSKPSGNQPDHDQSDSIHAAHPDGPTNISSALSPLQAYAASFRSASFTYPAASHLHFELTSRASHQPPAEQTLAINSLLHTLWPAHRHTEAHQAYSPHIAMPLCISTPYAPHVAKHCSDSAAYCSMPASYIEAGPTMSAMPDSTSRATPCARLTTRSEQFSTATPSPFDQPSAAPSHRSQHGTAAMSAFAKIGVMPNIQEVTISAGCSDLRTLDWEALAAGLPGLRHICVPLASILGVGVMRALTALEGIVITGDGLHLGELIELAPLSNLVCLSLKESAAYRQILQTEVQCSSQSASDMEGNMFDKLAGTNACTEHNIQEASGSTELGSIAAQTQAEASSQQVAGQTDAAAAGSPGNDLQVDTVSSSPCYNPDGKHASQQQIDQAMQSDQATLQPICLKPLSQLSGLIHLQQLHLGLQGLQGLSRVQEFLFELLPSLTVLQLEDARTGNRLLPYIPAAQAFFVREQPGRESVQLMPAYLLGNSHTQTACTSINPGCFSRLWSNPARIGSTAIRPFACSKATSYGTIAASLHLLLRVPQSEGHWRRRDSELADMSDTVDGWLQLLDMADWGGQAVESAQVLISNPTSEDCWSNILGSVSPGNLASFSAAIDWDTSARATPLPASFSQLTDLELAIRKHYGWRALPLLNAMAQEVLIASAAKLRSLVLHGCCFRESYRGMPAAHAGEVLQSLSCLTRLVLLDNLQLERVDNWLQLQGALQLAWLPSSLVVLQLEALDVLGAMPQYPIQLPKLQTLHLKSCRVPGFSSMHMPSLRVLQIVVCAVYAAEDTEDPPTSAFAQAGHMWPCLEVFQLWATQLWEEHDKWDMVMSLSACRCLREINIINPFILVLPYEVQALAALPCLDTLILGTSGLSRGTLAALTSLTRVHELEIALMHQLPDHRRVLEHHLPSFLKPSGPSHSTEVCAYVLIPAISSYRALQHPEEEAEEEQIIQTNLQAVALARAAAATVMPPDNAAILTAAPAATNTATDATSSGAAAFATDIGAMSLAMDATDSMTCIATAATDVDPATVNMTTNATANTEAATTNISDATANTTDATATIHVDDQATATYSTQSYICATATATGDAAGSRLGTLPVATDTAAAGGVTNMKAIAAALPDTAGNILGTVNLTDSTTAHAATNANRGSCSIEVTTDMDIDEQLTNHMAGNTSKAASGNQNTQDGGVAGCRADDRLHDVTMAEAGTSVNALQIGTSNTDSRAANACTQGADSACNLRSAAARCLEPAGPEEPSVSAAADGNGQHRVGAGCSRDGSQSNAAAGASIALSVADHSNLATASGDDADRVQADTVKPADAHATTSSQQLTEPDQSASQQGRVNTAEESAKIEGIHYNSTEGIQNMASTANDHPGDEPTNTLPPANTRDIPPWNKESTPSEEDAKALADVLELRTAQFSDWIARASKRAGSYSAECSRAVLA